MARRVWILSVLLGATLAAVPAGAHQERPTESPARPGSVPDQNREPTAVLDVCKTGECAFEHIQAAVDAAPDGALIRIWPGTYHEEPSLAQPDLPPDSADGTYSYEFHVQNPNAQNLIAVVGKEDITLRGMGGSPRDVVIDAGFRKHVTVRGDRSDGLIIENLSVWHGGEHGVYILDTDGFVIDRVHSGYSTDYAFLTFANDHGLMKNCEAFGAGDGGLYPGGSADVVGRFSMEIDRCRSYHNVLGYSGTQGDSVWVHDSEFFDNAVGLVSDSETDHPNFPQNNLLFERNLVYDNNFNPYLETSDVEATVFRGFAYLPVGTGVFLVSGNENVVQNSRFWGNDRYGVWLAAGQGLVLGPTGPIVSNEPFAPPFLGSGNRFLGNRMFGPNGERNGIDFAWDGLGWNNCWEANVGTADGAEPTTDAVFLPSCSLPLNGEPPPTTLGVPNASNLLAQAELLYVGDEPLCHRLGRCVWGPGPAPGNARNRAEGYQPPPDPMPCGPSTCG